MKEKILSPKETQAKKMNTIGTAIMNAQSLFSEARTASEEGNLSRLQAMLLSLRAQTKKVAQHADEILNEISEQAKTDHKL